MDLCSSGLTRPALLQADCSASLLSRSGGGSRENCCNYSALRSRRYQSNGWSSAAATAATVVATQTGMKMRPLPESLSVLLQTLTSLKVQIAVVCVHVFGLAHKGADITAQTIGSLVRGMTILLLLLLLLLQTQRQPLPFSASRV